jgi:hypothetical protein
MAKDDDAHLGRLKAAVPLILDAVERLPRAVPGLTIEEASLCLETAAKVIGQLEGWPARLDVSLGWEDTLSDGSTASRKNPWARTP